MKHLPAFLKQLPDLTNAQDHGVYPSSVDTYQKTTVFLSDIGDTDVLIAYGPDADRFKGRITSEEDVTYLVGDLSHENADILRSMFPYTKPVKVLHEKRSFGLGDRLGIAGDGHLLAIMKTDVFPVLAQQSIRELKMTGRAYENVLDAATYAVFKNGYKGGFGADGDHLKTAPDIEYALSLGFSMITLDCSDHIKGDIPDDLQSTITLSEEVKDRYLGKTFDVDGTSIHFDEASLLRAAYVYDDAIGYTVKIFDTYLKATRPANFELSIDETATTTTPTEHYYVANELTRQGVILDTLAPRFCGEFQKGIDYIGPIPAFEKDLDVHARIARHFGYKLSIHSGSDKFSIFESIGRLTRGNFHVKTAGTNWLEAVRVVAMKDPDFYREIHRYAIKMFPEAQKSYHVTTNLSNIPDIDLLTNDQIPSLLDHDDARQLIHITYGFILNKTDDQDVLVYKDRFFELIRTYKDVYRDRLDTHIGKHLSLLLKGAKDQEDGHGI